MIKNPMTNNSNAKWRTRLIIVNIIIIVVLVSISIPRISSTIDAVSEKDNIKSCNIFYYSDNYLGLLTTLHHNQSTHKRYNKYWEIAEAYEIYCQYQLWDTAANRLDSKTDVYEQKAAALSGEMIEAYNNFTFEENRDRFLPYIQSLQNKYN